MPLLAYFSWAGCALIGLLFLIDPYIATPRNIVTQAERYFPIRIKSNTPKPDLVTFDTSVPTIVPKQQVLADVQPEAPPVAPVVANAFGNLREGVPAIKKVRKRIAKSTDVKTARLNQPEVSGLWFSPSY